MVARWREFEIEVAGFFQRAGFRVEMNPKAARPRQTDVYAYDDKLRLLVEVKDRKRPIDIGDVDAVRSRLNRTTSDVIGVMFSTSPLSDGAKAGIETDRTRIILTFVEDEIEQLRNSQQNIRSLIELKRESLTVRGRVWENSGRPSRYLKVPLPSGDVLFRLGKFSEQYFESRSRFSCSTYALKIHDTGWGLSDGEGVRIQIPVALNNIDDLHDLMGCLHKTFGPTRSGMFFIQQTESCWYGIGAKEFIEAAGQWSERYNRSSTKRFYHSEELGYYDSFHTGWIHVSAQQRVGYADHERNSFLHHAEITIQLSGVPLDTAPFLRLCQYVNNDWAHFDSVKRSTASHRFKTSPRLDVLGKVLKRDLGPDEGPSRLVVIAVIARNPFYRKASLPKEFSDPEMMPLRHLVEHELLLCSLRDWHDEDSQPDFYYLEGVEATYNGTGPMLRPYGTWNSMREDSA